MRALKDFIRLTKLGYYLAKKGDYYCKVLISDGGDDWLEAEKIVNDKTFNFQIWINHDGSFGIGSVEIDREPHIVDSGLWGGNTFEAVYNDLEELIKKFLEEGKLN